MNTPPFRRAGLLSRSVPLVYGTDILFLAIEGFIIGLFAPTIRRHGPTHEFRDAVDAANQAGPGVILDWVQGHFLSDAHGLGQFSGTAHYEHADPREGYHPGRLAPGRGGFHAVSRSLAQGG